MRRDVPFGRGGGDAVNDCWCGGGGGCNGAGDRVLLY